MTEEELLPKPGPLDLSGANITVRSADEIKRDRLFNGGPGLVKNNQGVWVDENRAVPGGMRAGDFYRLSPTQQQQYRNERLEQQGRDYDAKVFGWVPGGKPKWMPGVENLAQVVNAISSPQFSESTLTGAVNAGSQFGNALGDLVQGKPIDTSDAWLIDEKTTRQLNPGRYSSAGFQAENTAADEAAAPWGRLVSAELAGLYTTGGAANVVRRVPMLANWANRARSVVQNSRQAQQLSLASQTGVRVFGNSGPRVQTMIGGANLLRDGLASTAAATIYMDPKLDGNTANSLDGVVFDPSDTNLNGVPFLRQAKEGEEGIELPGRVSEDDNYLEAWGKTVAIDGLLAPLTLFGGLSTVKPVRRFMLDQNVPRFMQELEQVDLARYDDALRNSASRGVDPGLVVDPPVQQAAPTGDGFSDFAKPLNATPGDLATPGRAAFIDGRAPDPWDSAIGRSTAASVQGQQVATQRQRLVDMGLMTRSADGQFELTFPQNVDPAVKGQIEELQAARTQAVDAGDVEEATRLDTDIQNLMEGRGRQQAQQGEFDIDSLPEGPPPSTTTDTRPEISTFLAELDELDDAQLRDMLPKVNQKEKLKARQAELEATEALIAEQRGLIAEINERTSLPEGSKKRLSPVGAKRKLNKANAEIEQLQATLLRLKAPEVTPIRVGDQLELAMGGRVNEGVDQIAIPGTDRTSLAGLKFMDLQWDEQSQAFTFPNYRANADRPLDVGYASVDDYRNSLMEYPRDLLREWLKPTQANQSPMVAAILKARTGRRVWSAKKGDLVDALVEYAQRQGKYLPRAEQPELSLVNTTPGDPALAGTPMGQAGEVNVPADLSTGALRTVEDADGAAAVVPDVPFPGGRGMPPMDEAARESIKKKILDAAVENGEVQADRTPIPQLPTVEFNQATFIDKLMADETGQMAWQFANDVTPVYEAGGKNAETIIEEMRARMGWAELDNKAQLAARMDFWQAKLYGNLDFETAKKMQILDDNFWNPPTLYVEPQTIPVPENTGTPSIPQRAVIEQNAPQTPTEASYYRMPWPGGGDLEDVKPALKKVFRWRPKGLVPEAIAETADEAAAVAKPKRSRRAKKKAEPQNSREALDTADLNTNEKREIKQMEEARQQLLARRERAAKLAEEASC